MEVRVSVGDVFQVTDLKNAKFRTAPSWSDGIEFKTKTTKPVLYLVIRRDNQGSLEMYPLNPPSQFQSVYKAPVDFNIYSKEDWKKIWNSLKYLGHLDESVLDRMQSFDTNYWSNDYWNYLDSITKDLYKEWSQKAKDQGFVEEPVEGWTPKGKHLNVAYDFLGQEVRVGDTVAYVHLYYGESLQTGSVLSITPSNFVLQTLDGDGRQARPHKYVIKIDPSKVQK